ncbi:MAG: lytic murein transglycosylase [Hyphomicrobium sp.]
MKTTNTASLAAVLTVLVSAQPVTAQQPFQAKAKPAAVHAVPSPPPANNRNCQNTGNFDAWFAAFKKEAIAEGIKPATIQAALGDVTLDPSIIGRDRKQSFFNQTFLEFYGKLATKNRYEQGKKRVSQHRDVFDRAEKEFGIPAAVITAFWALESDFGVGMGKLSVLRSLATLAYDCRRGEMFRSELKAAMRIIERGDLRAEDMIGSWAGELGQTQFLPAHYLNHALDYDGDGKRDLIHSIPDIIGSTAAFIKTLDWQRGEPWLEEVKVPANLAWDQSDLAIKHPRSKWAGWGVTGMTGKLPADQKPASLLLPMGRNGPAFLAYLNFDVYLKWNQSLTYAITAAHLAARITGAPAVSNGNGQPIPVMTAEDVKELQVLLKRRGYDVGEPDGKIGAGTRAAVKAMQLKLGQIADSYPTPELLQALRGAR